MGPIIKKLKDVQVGSLLIVGGAKYKVVRNLHTNLHVVKEIFPGAYKQEEQGLSGLQAKSLNPDSLIVLYSEPKATLTAAVPKGNESLTDSLRQQVKRNELTASLKAQLEDEDDDFDTSMEHWPEEYYDEDEDLDDEDWDEDDDEDGYDAYFNPYHTYSHFSTLDGVTKEQALKTDIKAQLAQQGALNASLKAQAAQKAVGKVEVTAKAGILKVDNKVEDVISGINRKFNEVEAWGTIVADKHNAFVEHVETAIEAVEDDIVDIDNDLSDLEKRLQKLEAAKAQEEKQMNLQQQLNARLAANKSQSALQAQLDAKLNQNKKSIGGNGTMKNLLGAFKNQFGKVEGKFAFSPATNGLAIRKGISNQFAAFNGVEITDVQDFVLKFDVPAFKLPVAAADVKKGDIVLNGADYGFVTRVNDGYVETVNVEKNVRGSVLPTKNILFGQSFYTVVKTLDAAGQGGFDPMLLLALGKGDTDEILPFLLMSGGLGGEAGAINPMLLMALKDKTSDLLPFLLMQQGGVMGEGFNPLMLLAMGDDKGGKDLLPLMLMSQGQAGAGAINPMMLLAMGDGELDLTTLALMGGLGGQGGQGFGGLFGGQASAPTAEVKAKK